MERPRIAIIDENTLTALGLKQLLLNVLPIMTVDTFGSMDELQDAQTTPYAHYFASAAVVRSHSRFFAEHRRKTIVLTPSADDAEQFPQYHCLHICQSERDLVRSLLLMQQHAHHDGRNLPPMPQVLQQRILSDREIEVLALIVEGYINKEIADRLNISLSTVVTHRRNIMDKLGMRSVSALTIYAVMHGYVDINRI